MLKQTVRRMVWRLQYQTGRAKVVALRLTARWYGLHLGVRSAMQPGMHPVVVVQNPPGCGEQMCAALFPDQQFDLYDVVGETAHAAHVYPCPKGLSMSTNLWTGIKALHGAATELRTAV